MPPTGKVLFTTVDRYEHVSDISVTKLNQQYQLPTKGGLLPNDRFIYSLEIEWLGRATNPAASGPTAALADGPYQLIDNIDVQGKHRIRKTQEDFLTLRSAELRELDRILRGNAPYVNPAALSVVASATNDIRFKYEVTFPPLGLPMGFQIGYLLDAPNYDALALTIQQADDFSIFSGQTTSPTFTAYGSGAGSPTIRVSAKFCMWPNGQANDAFVPGRVWRYNVKENTSGDIVAGALSSRQFDLPTGFVLSRLLLKSGVLSTTTSGRNRAYATLSDSILSNLILMTGLNRPTASYADYLDLKMHGAEEHKILPSTGYALLDFVGQGQVWEAFDATGFTQNSNLFLQTDVAAGANQADLMVAEEIRTRPRMPS